MDARLRDQGLVSIGRAAELLGVSVPTLRRWTSAGRVEGELTPGGHRRYRLDELRRVRESQAGNSAPRLRSPVLPAGPLTAFADALEGRALELASAAASHTYAPSTHGWFSSTKSDQRIVLWVGALAAACRAGTYDSAQRATAEFARDAMLAGYGVTVRECLVFIEIFGTMAARELGNHPEARDARRLISAVRLAPLEVSPFDEMRSFEPAEREPSAVRAA